MNIKEFLKKEIKLIAGFLSILVPCVIVTALLILKAPEYHASYIRSKVGEGVVVVLGEQGGGTGFHVKAKSGKTYILTNKHVCNISKTDTIDVIPEGTDRRIPRRIIERYGKHDLCLVEALPNQSGVSLGSELEIGQTIGIIGHPRLTPLTLQKGEYIGDATIQLVEAYNVTKEQCKGQFIDLSDTAYAFFGIYNVCLNSYETNQITAITYPGNSGSPIVNFWGNIVGVLFAGRQDVITEGYIVPLKYVKEFLSVY